MPFTRLAPRPWFFPSKPFTGNAGITDITGKSCTVVSAGCDRRTGVEGKVMGRTDKECSPVSGTPNHRDCRRRTWGPGWLSRGARVGALLATLLGTGCSLRQWVDNGFKVGPNYCKPPAPVESDWIDYRDPRVKSEAPDLAEWWHVFKDPALDTLIETAYQQNISLRVAGARILAARAERGVAAGELFPQVQQAYGDYQSVGLSRNVSNPFPKRWFSNWDTGLAASWEVDFWGRFRRGIEAADAELDASIENYDDVLVILLSEVATSYTQLRIFQDRLRFAWLNVVSQYNAYQLAANKHMLGAATERDLQQAKQILEQTRALVPQLETGIRQANNQLCTLLGMPPRELSEVEVGTYERELMPLKEVIEDRTRKIENAVKEFAKSRQKPAEDLPELLEGAKDPKVAALLKPLEDRQRTPVAPPQAVVGIPADLLRRRPDVRRAERQVAAQSARIGVAEADFYPRFALNGTIGLASEKFGDLFSPGAFLGAVGPSFRWDILNYGRILNNVRAQDARFQGLAFTYQNTVLQAGREAEDGIVGYLKAQEQTHNLEASVNAASRTVQISFDQYREGAVDFTPVVLFESTLAGQQDALAVARGNIALNLIATYRALGGGWEMRLAREGGHGRETTPFAISAGGWTVCLTREGAHGGEPVVVPAERAPAPGPESPPPASSLPATPGSASVVPTELPWRPAAPATRTLPAAAAGGSKGH
jgi:outer membrane protein TolC